MDSITHSLSGALVANFIESRPTSPVEKANLRQTFFWLFIVSSNIPDIDVVFGLLGDPKFSINFHRGLTHSLLFAPLFAFLPAAGFGLFSKVKNIRILWLVAVLGIVMHIFFDLITSFGTQILSPFFNTKYSLDWMYIFDPWFELLVIAILLAGKFLPGKKTIVATMGVLLVALYIGVAAFNQGIARMKV